MVRPAAALPVAALVLAGAACGSSEHPAAGTTTPQASAAAAAVRAAVAKTVAAGSEHVAIAASSTVNGQKVTLSGGGDFDSKLHRGTLHATISLGVDVTIDEVLDGTTAYVRSPLLASVLPAGKSWLKVDLSTAGTTFGVDTSILRAQDPAVALAQLTALRDLAEVGSSQTVGGVRATRYRGTIDVSKLPRGSAGVVAQTGAKLGPVDVWVGDDGYVRRERLVTTAVASGQTVKTVVTQSLSRFGAPVQVTVPAASAAVDSSKVSIPGLGG